MTAALGVDALLRSNGLEYATVFPDRTAGPKGRHAPSIRGEQVARTVLLAGDRGCALAMIPRDRHLDLVAIEEEFGRRLRMAGTAEVARLFPGLAPRALPPITDGTRLETFVDQSLVPLSAVYFETANPYRLVRIDGESFRGLLYGAWCGRISRGES